jgi:diguanylate cyclase (GGDEF)-like protein
MLDITDRKVAEERIAFLAYHDKLTGLPNRTMFDELLGLALARAKRHDLGVVVVTVDIDDFKLVNDSLGHHAGDDLLVQFAHRLGDATRDTDLIARPGGDEFLLLLGDLERTSPLEGGLEGTSMIAESIASRIQDALRRPFTVDGTELYVTASLGISAYPDDAPDAATLLKNAETAMFRSKRSGPGGYVIHSTGDADSIHRLSLSTRLRRAVEEEQWTLHYQPVIDLRSAKTTGVEALIRWPDARGGLIPPAEFIPLAEEMGLIEAIGAWVIEEVSRQGAAWRAEGLDLEIAFTLSPRQLWQEDLADRILTPIRRAGMDPERVTVEVTESTAMTNPDRTLGILQDLHDRGLRLAIDDFGTGYSSLARLRYMPVHVLKIDRSFVHDLDRDAQNASMVSAMVALASNLGMTAVAEGIETDAEWRALTARGCTVGQGFFFSPPVPAPQILAMHRRSGLRIVEGGAAG